MNLFQMVSEFNIWSGLAGQGHYPRGGYGISYKFG
jgi:hypothetical protein